MSDRPATARTPLIIPEINVNYTSELDAYFNNGLAHDFADVRDTVVGLTRETGGRSYSPAIGQAAMEAVKEEFKGVRENLRFLYQTLNPQP